MAADDETDAGLATYVLGHATSDGLTATQYKLSGEVQYTVELG